MLSSDLLTQIRHLEIRAGHLVTEALSGEYVSVFRGQGIEFDEVRAYVPGDDIRRIDWNVTARMSYPFVKIHKEEREQTLMLMVDVSPSQLFGTGAREKNELSAELAAVLAFLATRNNDKVGLIIFSDSVEKYIPPKKGRSHIWRIIREILSYKGSGQKTDVSLALEYMQRVTKRRTMCFLISDFHAKDFSRALLLAARRHDLVCAHIYDEKERELPRIGFVEMQDAETGERILVDTSSAQFQKKYRELNATRLKTFTKFLKQHGIDYMPIAADRGVVKPLEDFLKFRERRTR